MATSEQTFAAPDTHEPMFNRVLTRAYTLDWQMIAYTIIFVAAVLTRFIDLGARVMSHDESLHTYYSWRLYEFGEFSHTPLMHGPVIFHMVAFSYYLFGDNDFTARIYPAVLGVLMVLFPLLFRRWLGRVGAVLTSILLLISPMVLFHNRYIREDTPSLFFTLIMVYAIMQYVDGERPHRPIWLYVLSGALLLSLASKEVAFMYIAIFGSFLVLYWAVRLLQDMGVHRERWSAYRTEQAEPYLVRLAGLGITLGVIGVVAWLAGSFVRFAMSASRWYPSAIIFQLPIFLVLVLLVAIWELIPIGNPQRRSIGLAVMRGLANGRSAFKVILTGVILGAVLALLIVCILDVIHPSSIWKPETVRSVYEAQHGQNMTKEFAQRIDLDDEPLVRLITWIGLPALALIFIVFLTAVFKFPGHLALPWREILLIILIAALVTAALVAFERRSYIESSDTTPFAAQVDAATGKLVNDYPRMYLNASWLIMGLGTVAVVVTRLFTPALWDFLRRQRIFDVLIVIGTMSLPWLSAYPVWQTGYNMEDLLLQPIPDPLLHASIEMLLAFSMLSLAVGLAWDWRRWLPAALVFGGLFAFFFTTVFNNKWGVITGATGSLGYWLEQQEVRRASQPQYYYVLTQLPVYEFLPVLGSIFAGITGLSMLWRWRRDQAEITQQEIEAYYEEQDYYSEAETLLDNAADVTVISEAQTTRPFEVPASPLPPMDDPYRLLPVSDVPKPKREPAPESQDREWLGNLPFLGMLGYWAILIVYALTVAGEKMPWLTTHLTVPMIFITGWWLGRVFNEIHWDKMMDGGWLLLLVALPLLFLGLVEVFLPLWSESGPFQGRGADQLAATGQWFLALFVLLGALYLVGRFGRQLGLAQIGRMAILSGFALLAILTARTAFVAAYINYDYAREFMVYAHSGPAVKTVLAEVDRIAEITNQGYNLRIAFDDESSWPYTWYFRHYQNSYYMSGDAASNNVRASDLEGTAVVVVGYKKADIVRQILGDRYYEFNYFRLWWPMQDYFGLSSQQITDFFSTDEYNIAAPYYRDGVFDIWFNREYGTYAQAQCIKQQQYTCEEQAKQARNDDERESLLNQCAMTLKQNCKDDKRFSVNNWPVSDRMYVFVNKEIAAQVWDAGVGSAQVDIREPVYAEDQVYRDLVAEQVIGQDAGLNSPHGIDVDDDGLIYVADTENNQIVVFSPNGEILRKIGSYPGGTNEDGALKQPWGVAVQDGYVYVADTWNNRVQVFTTTGEFVRKWGHEGVPEADPSTDAFWGPRDIEVGLDGKVYVADTGGKRIRVYEPDGTWVQDIGSGGAARGQVDEPVGLAIDPVSGNLIVAEAWNTRIQVFDASGMSVNMFSVSMWQRNRESYNRPYIAVSEDGVLIYVADMDDHHRIVAYDFTGRAVVSFSHPDNLQMNETGLRSPAGVAVGPDGRLYVVDSQALQGEIAQYRIFVFPANEIRGDLGPVQGLQQPVEEPEVQEPEFPTEQLPVGSSNNFWAPMVQVMNGVPMMYVPGGCFMMGDEDGQGGNEICLNSYWISETEITRAQYAVCVAAGACSVPQDTTYYNDPAMINAPMVSITWMQAQEYAAWLGAQLPSEAQWEYAARGPEGWAYPWGQTPPSCDVANYVGCGGLLPVSAEDRWQGASWVGAVDMAGSVAEWTADWDAEGYYAALEPGSLDPTGPADGTQRVARGGSYNDPAMFSLVTRRIGREPNTGYQTVGLRVVMPISTGDVPPEWEMFEATAETTIEATEPATAEGTAEATQAAAG